MIKGSHQSLEAKTKISQYQLGRKRSSDTRIKMSTSQKRENLSLEARKNRSIAKRGNKNPMFGKVLSLKHRRKISEANKGDKHYNWKGGITTEKQRRARNQSHREALKFGSGGNHTLEEWETLKAQYNWVCPSCYRSEPEIKLTEDHIIPIIKGGSDNIENIQPLCLSCNCIKHTKIIKYEKLHKKECKSCPWNGTTIFPSKKQ